jgi:hypothetical protein
MACQLCRLSGPDKPRDDKVASLVLELAGVKKKRNFLNEAATL